MREYLFRAKAAENKGIYKIGEWVHGSLRRTTMDDFYIYDFGTDIKIEINPETIGQYTGLKDRNGRMVYEGDIVQDPELGTLAEIVWNKENARFYVHFFGENANPEFINGFDKIGNKWDNKELIKGMHGPVLAYTEDEE